MRKEETQSSAHPKSVCEEMTSTLAHFTEEEEQAWEKHRWYFVELYIICGLSHYMWHVQNRNKCLHNFFTAFTTSR